MTIRVDGGYIASDLKHPARFTPFGEEVIHKQRRENMRERRHLTPFKAGESGGPTTHRGT